VNKKKRKNERERERERERRVRTHLFGDEGLRKKFWLAKRARDERLLSNHHTRLFQDLIWLCSRKYQRRRLWVETPRILSMIH